MSWLNISERKFKVRKNIKIIKLLKTIFIFAKILYMCLKNIEGERVKSSLLRLIKPMFCLHEAAWPRLIIRRKAVTNLVLISATNTPQSATLIEETDIKHTQLTTNTIVTHPNDRLHFAYVEQKIQNTLIQTFMSWRKIQINTQKCTDNAWTEHKGNEREEQSSALTFQSPSFNYWFPEQFMRQETEPFIHNFLACKSLVLAYALYAETTRQRKNERDGSERKWQKKKNGAASRRVCDEWWALIGDRTKEWTKWHVYKARLPVPDCVLLIYLHLAIFGLLTAACHADKWAGVGNAVV